MILVIAATEFEIAPFLAKEQHHVDVLITGVGAASTLYHLQKRLHQIDYDLVIQAGIAGTFNKAIDLGETVFIKKDCFGDIGMEEKENFTPIFQSGFADPNAFPFEAGWLINEQEYLNTLPLPLVTAVTVNKVSDSLIQKRQLVSIFDPQVESMEGAALHYVCLQEKIPFYQLRGISNEVGERDKSKWKIKDAINHLNANLLAMVKQAISLNNY